MKNLCKIRITSSPVQALNKLKRADIPVFNCKKEGAYFTFEVSNNYVKKVFAIFAHPCYNVIIKGKSPSEKLLGLLAARPCIAIGPLLFAAFAAAANAFVLKIEVTGSGSYLKDEVLSIAGSAGIKTYAPYSGTDEPYMLASIMALPRVTFCSVNKSGSVLYIDVQVTKESAQAADYASLCADVSGTVEKIVAACGTPLVSAGDSVNKGDTLIGAYCLNGDEKESCLAAGYARINCSASISLFYGEESEENRAAALAAAVLYAENDEILSRGATVKKVADGVIYTVDFTYLHTISINYG